MESGQKIPSLYPKVGKVLENHEGSSVIRYDAYIDPQHVAAFARVVGYSGPGIPPTFFTFYRWGEFTWLNRLKVSLESIVHTEQEYEYFSSVSPGVTVIVETRVTQVRERRGIKMIDMTTTINHGDKKVAASVTSFLSRELPKPGEAV
jgi:acyl dehydratase